MKNNKGFTLIEMLVVVAIIGILSATVLVALGPSRDKARDSRIMGAVQQARALYEASYDATKGTYELSAETTTKLGQLEDDVTAQDSTLTHTGDATNEYVISAPLKSDATKTFCADSTGFSGMGTASGSACTPAP
ncbi:MAG: type II secretion system protein [Patescibacteria group bacterium]